MGVVKTIEVPVETFSFEKLDVWQKAFNVSILVHRSSLTFPKIEQYALADQIRRASKSICANIAEGFGKQKASKAEFKRFLLMALGSSNEMLVWIKYCSALEYIDQIQHDLWVQEYTSICIMLNALHGRA